MYRAENTDFFILLKRIFVIRYNLYVEIFRDEKRGRFFYRKIRDAAEKRKEKTGNEAKGRKKRKNFKKNEKS